MHHTAYETQHVVWWCALTRNDAFLVKRVKRIIHELPVYRCLVSTQFILHDERVVAVVDVGGLVEEQTAVLNGAVGRVSDQFGVGVACFDERQVVVQPSDGGRRIAVHSEWETPVMLWLWVLQKQDPHWN